MALDRLLTLHLATHVSGTFDVVVTRIDVNVYGTRLSEGAEANLDLFLNTVEVSKLRRTYRVRWTDVLRMAFDNFPGYSQLTERDSGKLFNIPITTEVTENGTVRRKWFDLQCEEV